MKKYIPLFYGLLSFLMLESCQSKKTELVWDQSFYNIGSQSSPKARDLNADGILDIVMGGGNAEMGPTKFGVFAVDGKTGELLWQQKTNAQMVGSATFFDLTEDGIDDVFIGGRKHNLKAINGKTGTLIWEYEYQFEKDSILKNARFNFYNSTLVPNKNQKNNPDLLTVNGGNWDAFPNSMADRHPGVLMLFDLKSGTVIAADTMPDGQESYLSPVCFSQKNDDEQNIIFGTGGETASGNLYWTTVADLKNKKLSAATLIASEIGHGFIAPPVVADINADGILDVIAISHAATIFAIDGKSKQLLWKKAFKNKEASASFAVGYFNSDKIPDFFINLSEGVWPDYSKANQVLIDGANGNVIYQDSMGCFGLSSPVVADLNYDGLDEIILSVNQFSCDFKLTAKIRTPPTIKNQIVALGFDEKFSKVIDETEDFKNMFSTPWVGDLDQDGFLDIVYCQYYNADDLFRFLGMRVKRISTSISIKEPLKWGEYMGAGGRGIFQ